MRQATPRTPPPPEARPPRLRGGGGTCFGGINDRAKGLISINPCIVSNAGQYGLTLHLFGTQFFRVEDEFLLCESAFEPFEVEVRGKSLVTGEVKVQRYCCGVVEWKKFVDGVKEFASMA